jgi:uncharacterized membrane protein YphA (DoxX/SURF4 family)
MRATNVYSSIAIVLGVVWIAAACGASIYINLHGFPEWFAAYSEPWGTPSALADALLIISFSVVVGLMVILLLVAHLYKEQRPRQPRYFVPRNRGKYVLRG